MTTLLIANRGEIACRIARSAQSLGMRVVAVYSDADAGAPHVRLADEAIHLGPAPVVQSYLDVDAVLDAIGRSGADAVHPGYGFLSENVAFADAVIAQGCRFVGPDAETIRAMGDKSRAREIASDAGVPVLPASVRIGEAEDIDLDALVAPIGTPFLVKAAGGGGGIGMKIVDELDRGVDIIEGTRAAAKRFFGNGDVYLERFVANARHIEIQVLGAGDGTAIHLFERDCSLQRRFQKVIEESPAPNVDRDVVEDMAKAAVRLAAAQRYRGVGTVEFIYDVDTSDYFFLEMNTRLQVEHPVTEMLTGLDLVRLQFAAAGLVDDVLPRQSAVTTTGHAIEARVYAERPAKGFLPSTGMLHRYVEPTGSGIRVDAGVSQGSAISSHYDPMIAKVISHGEDRSQAITRLSDALAEFKIEGVETNIPFLRACLSCDSFSDGKMTTRLIETRHRDLVEWSRKFDTEALQPG